MKNLIVTGIKYHDDYPDIECVIFMDLDTLVMSHMLIDDFIKLMAVCRDGKSDIKIHNTSIKGIDLNSRSSIHLAFGTEKFGEHMICSGKIVYDKSGYSYTICTTGRIRTNGIPEEPRTDVPIVNIRPRLKSDTEKVNIEFGLNTSIEYKMYTQNIGHGYNEISIVIYKAESKVMNVPDGVDEVNFSGSKEDIKIKKISLGQVYGAAPEFEDSKFGMWGRGGKIDLDLDYLQFREGITTIPETFELASVNKNVYYPKTLHELNRACVYAWSKAGKHLEEYNTGDGVVSISTFDEYVSEGLRRKCHAYKVDKIVLGKNCIEVMGEAFNGVKGVERIEIHSDLCFIDENTFDIEAKKSHKPLVLAVRRNAKIKIRSQKLIEMLRSKKCVVEYLD